MHLNPAQIPARSGGGQNGSPYDQLILACFDNNRKGNDTLGLGSRRIFGETLSSDELERLGNFEDICFFYRVTTQGDNPQPAPVPKEVEGVDPPQPAVFQMHREAVDGESWTVRNMAFSENHPDALRDFRPHKLVYVGPGMDGGGGGSSSGSGASSPGSGAAAGERSGLAKALSACAGSATEDFVREQCSESLRVLRSRMTYGSESSKSAASASAASASAASAASASTASGSPAPLRRGRVVRVQGAPLTKCRSSFDVWRALAGCAGEVAHSMAGAAALGSLQQLLLHQHPGTLAAMPEVTLLTCITRLLGGTLRVWAGHAEGDRAAAASREECAGEWRRALRRLAAGSSGSGGSGGAEGSAAAAAKHDTVLLGHLLESVCDHVTRSIVAGAPAPAPASAAGGAAAATAMVGGGGEPAAPAPAAAAAAAATSAPDEAAVAAARDFFLAIGDALPTGNSRVAAAEPAAATPAPTPLSLLCYAKSTCTLLDYLASAPLLPPASLRTVCEVLKKLLSRAPSACLPSNNPNVPNSSSSGSSSAASGADGAGFGQQSWVRLGEVRGVLMEELQRFRSGSSSAPLPVEHSAVIEMFEAACVVAQPGVAPWLSSARGRAESGGEEEAAASASASASASTPTSSAGGEDAGFPLFVAVSTRNALLSALAYSAGADAREAGGVAAHAPPPPKLPRRVLATVLPLSALPEGGAGVGGAAPTSPVAETGSGSGAADVSRASVALALVESHSQLGLPVPSGGDTLVEELDEILCDLLWRGSGDAPSAGAAAGAESPSSALVGGGAAPAPAPGTSCSAATASTTLAPFPSGSFTPSTPAELTTLLSAALATLVQLGRISQPATDALLLSPPLRTRAALLAAAALNSSSASPFLRSAVLRACAVGRPWHATGSSPHTPHLTGLLQPWSEAVLAQALQDSAGSQTMQVSVKVDRRKAGAMTPWDNPSGWRAEGRDPRDSKALFSQLYSGLGAQRLEIFTRKEMSVGGSALASPRIFACELLVGPGEPKPHGIGHAVNALNDALCELFQPGLLALLEPVSLSTGASLLGAHAAAPSPLSLPSLPRPTAPTPCCEFLGLLMGWSLRFSAVLPLDWHPAVWRFLVGAPRASDAGLLEPRAAPMEALRRGLGAVVPLSALAGMPWRYMRARVAGSADIDVGVLAAHCEYSPELGCRASHPTCVELWSVLRGWDSALLGKLLKSVLGTSRLPTGQQWQFQVKLHKGTKLCKSFSCQQILYLPADTGGNLDWALRELLASG